MRSAACRDSEIFVVALGTMDVVGECVGMPVAAMRKTALDNFEEDEMCDTLKNVREICDALRADGKKVGLVLKLVLVLGWLGRWVGHPTTPTAAISCVQSPKSRLLRFVGVSIELATMALRLLG